MLVICKATLPVLVIVTYCDAPDVPTASVPNDKFVAESVTGATGATPVPLNAMLCGDPLALSVIVIAAVCTPVAVGAKCPWIEQFAPTATLAPHVFANTNEDALAPVTPMLVIDSAVVPVFVSVTYCDPLISFTVTEPNDKLVVDKVTGGTKPVPLNAMLCGDPAALSVIVTAAVKAPLIVGAKCPCIVHSAPTARLAPQLLANTNEEASAPVTAMLEIVSATAPVFVNVTYCDPLIEPTFVDPNERLVADRVTGGTRPVPLSAMLCGDPATLSVIVTAAVNAPTAVGAKCPWIVQVAPAARLDPQLLPNTKDEAPAPVTAMLVIDNADSPLLVSTTYCDALAAPTVSLPNERLFADNETPGGGFSASVIISGTAIPLPVSHCP